MNPKRKIVSKEMYSVMLNNGFTKQELDDLNVCTDEFVITNCVRCQKEIKKYRLEFFYNPTCESCSQEIGGSHE